MHFKLCTTHSKLCTTHFQFTTNSEIFATHFEISTTHFEIFATHFEISTTHSPQDPKCLQRKRNSYAAPPPSIDAMFCSTCGQKLRENFVFCPKCGLELATNVAQGSCDIGSQKNIIETYFLAGFEYHTIVSFLEKFHGIHISLLTLEWRLRDYGLKRRNSADLNQRRIGWSKLHVWVPGHVAYTLPQIWPLYSQK